MVWLLWKTVPQKIKNRITKQSSNSTFDYITKRIEIKVSKRYWSTHVHSSIIHNNQKVQTAQKFIERGWISKMWSVHLMLYYSVIERKAVLTPATMTCVVLEDMMLSEPSRSQKDACSLVSLTEGAWRNQTVEMESRVVSVLGGGHGRGGIIRRR